VRNVITFRRVISLVLPGAVLLFIAWALQQEQTVRQEALPYAAFTCFATVGASTLLSGNGFLRRKDIKDRKDPKEELSQFLCDL